MRMSFHLLSGAGRLALLASIGLACNPAPSALGGSVTAGAGGGLPRTPAALASAGDLLAVADRGGSFLWWPWPGTPGPARPAHGDAGPIASGVFLVTSGGWDPT